LRRDVTWNVVEPGYFDALRLPVVAGRDFDDDDKEGTEQVAIVGERAARTFYPDGDAIGRLITQHGFGSAPTRVLRIVGIARDPTHGSLIDAANGGAYVYVPLQQQFLPRMLMVTRTMDGRSIGADLASIANAVSPRLTLGPAQDAVAYAAVGLLPQRIAVTIASVLGISSLLLASGGIYGVTAHTMARRTREIGIRLALGAQCGQILAAVIWQSLSLSAIGSVIGLTLAAASSQFLRRYLLGVAPLDPTAFAGATMLVIVVSLLASCAPARRAMNIDPVAALRRD
jgi:ABC-type antimicrobial peptide transport system permease subunit